MHKYEKTKQENTIYSKAEMPAVVKFNKAKVFFLHPIVKVLDKIGFTPNMISVFSALIVVISFCFYYFLDSPIYFIAGLWIHLVFDALDGTLARYQKMSSAKGAILDSACDHFGIIAASIFAYMLAVVDPVNIVIFAVFYSILMMIIFYLLKKKNNYFFIVRPRIYFYAALTIDVFWLFHITYYVVLIANMIMLAEIVLGIVRILPAKKIHF